MKQTASILCIFISILNLQRIYGEELQSVVKISNGQIQGGKLTTRLGKIVHSFKGIRYAKAPIKELRFQPPQPPEKWENVLNATQDGPACPQPDVELTSEDCLFLNVYTSKIPKKGSEDNPKQPVIVFIHPGSFYKLSGGSRDFGPHYLLDHDVVLVTFNYRVGSLGFISTGDKEAPGNLGLKDQVRALKWIKENIAHFGGSPDLVTIYGYGAGSASVMLHLVSPLSKGLFHRAIASSLSALGTWPSKNHQLNLAKKQAKLVGCPDDTSANIMKCLRTKPAEELGKSLSGFKEFGNDPLVIWEPVIEVDFGQERFLTENPVKLVVEGKFEKVPLITGITTDEFGCRAFSVVKNANLYQKLNEKFDIFAPISFGYERDTHKSKAISLDVRKFYFDEKPISNASLPELAQLYADSLSGFAVNRAAKLISDKNKEVFYYRFNYKGRYSHFYLPDTNNTVPYGVVHNDDLIYLFYRATRFPLFQQADPESRVVEKMTTLWANFAKTGNPTPSTSENLDNLIWEKFNRESNKFLDIGNKLTINEDLNEQRYDFWNKVIPLPQGTNLG